MAQMVEHLPSKDTTQKKKKRKKKKNVGPNEPSSGIRVGSKRYI
jgi:hypothetical protein